MYILYRKICNLERTEAIYGLRLRQNFFPFSLLCFASLTLRYSAIFSRCWQMWKVGFALFIS